MRFFLQAFFLPPVARLLCIESLEIPDITNKTVGIPWEIEKNIYTHKKACFFLVYVWILRKWRISNIQKFHQIIERKRYRRSYPSWPRSEVLSLSLSLSMLKPWLSGLKYETLVLFHAISRGGCFCHFSFYFKKKSFYIFIILILIFGLEGRFLCMGRIWLGLMVFSAQSIIVDLKKIQLNLPLARV